MECLIAKVTELHGMYRNNWIKETKPDQPMTKSSQTIFTDWLNIILKWDSPSLQVYSSSRKEGCVPPSGRWGMEAAKDELCTGFCGLKTLILAPLLISSMTERKSLNSSGLQPQPRQGGGKPFSGSTGEPSPGYAVIFHSCWQAQASSRQLTGTRSAVPLTATNQGHHREGLWGSGWRCPGTEESTALSPLPA